MVVNLDPGPSLANEGQFLSLDPHQTHIGVSIALQGEWLAHRKDVLLGKMQEGHTSVRCQTIRDLVSNQAQGLPLPTSDGPPGQVEIVKGEFFL